MARKLAVSQAEIVRYLSSQNLAIEEGSNVKLGEAHIRALYAHYAPSETFEATRQEEQRVAGAPAADTTNDTLAQSHLVVQNDIAAQNSVATRDSVFIQAKALTQENVVSEPHFASPGADSIQPDSEQKDVVIQPSSASAEVAPTAEVALSKHETDHNASAPLSAEQSDTIRAPKIELAGLKVLGKINLPEPKKKDSPLADDSAKTESADVPAIPGDGSNPRPDRRDDGRSRSRSEGRGQDERRRSRNNPPREQRPYKNPIAAQREREIEEELERRKQKAAQDKERKTQNYQKRVKHSPPTKAARLIEEPVEELNTDSLNDQPTSWFGKFMKWLRS